MLLRGKRGGRERDAKVSCGPSSRALSQSSLGRIFAQDSSAKDRVVDWKQAFTPRKKLRGIQFTLPQNTADLLVFSSF